MRLTVTNRLLLPLILNAYLSTPLGTVQNALPLTAKSQASPAEKYSSPLFPFSLGKQSQ